ncbi:MAG: hypothetical protein IPL51_13110 [Candidatus Competibacteraceae bacterium]|nr:hypothetical protein [Candidatus Competibacteraceae bacterium]
MQDNIFGTGNGIPPTSGVNIVYDDALDGPMLDLLARSPSTGSADFALDGAICHRNLVEGLDIVTGQPLTGEMRRFRTGPARHSSGATARQSSG